MRNTPVLRPLYTTYAAAPFLDFDGESMAGARCLNAASAVAKISLLKVRRAGDDGGLDILEEKGSKLLRLVDKDSIELSLGGARSCVLVGDIGGASLWMVY